jgi:glycosyltransferase involved in cell wall biosynthesis
MIVADGKGDEINEGVQIYDVGRAGSRLRRITVTLRQIRKRAIELNANIYHLHDPELLVIAATLMQTGKIVVFDAHEDTPAQVFSKPYIPRMLMRMVAQTYAAFESRVCRNLDAIVTATPAIREKFSRINQRVVDINNYPFPDEFVPIEPAIDRRNGRICYVGGISAVRGIRELVRAMELVSGTTRLTLCGNFSDQSLESEIRALPGWQRVDALGWQSRESVRDVLAQSLAGVVTFLPAPNHFDAQPNKMFEYMSAGLPLIASDFSLWREIVEGHNCGFCVDPERPGAIAEAIDFLAQNPESAEEMGANGRRAVQEVYNWPAEQKKLLALYEQLEHKASP